MTDSSCAKLIKKITSIPRQGDCFRIDERLLGGVKKLCKASDSNVEECMRYLLVDLAHKHGIVRLRSLAVIEVLFARSRRCREITAAGIQLVAAAGGLSMQSHQWPAGIDHEKVRRKVVYLVELWDQSHGHEYPSIFSMAKYFRETMRVRMPDTVRTLRAIAEENLRKKIIKQNSTILRGEKAISTDIPAILPQIESALQQLDSFISMLFPGLDNSATGLSVATMEQPASHPSALHNLDESDDDDTQQPDDSHEKNEVSAMQEEDDLSDDEDWIEEDLGEKSETLGALLEDFGGNVSSMRINLQDGANRVMENEDLSAVVSEIVKHTRTHLLPQLLCWRDILMESESVLQTRLSDNATSHHQSSTIGKRTRDMCEENDGAIDSTLTKKIDLFQGKIKIIDQYINRVKIMLDEKCKYLTKDAFALKVY